MRFGVKDVPHNGQGQEPEKDKNKGRFSLGKKVLRTEHVGKDRQKGGGG